MFRDRVKTVLQTYLLAAAIHGHDVAVLVRWAVSKPPDQEPVKLLHDGGYPKLAHNLRVESVMIVETSDAVWMSVWQVIEPLMDPQLRQLCTPGRARTSMPGPFCGITHGFHLVSVPRSHRVVLGHRQHRDSRPAR